MEEWRDIEGLEGYYQVSNTGSVRSLDREVVASIYGTKKILKGKMMKLTSSVEKSREQFGSYLVVNLRKEGKNKVWLVHQLVAKAFLDNPNNYPVVNHIDGNKHNNNVENLEWCTYRDNNIHALKNGLRKPRGNAIVQLSMEDRSIIAEFISVSEASRVTGIGRSSISHCVNGRIERAGGFYWEYK